MPVLVTLLYLFWRGESVDWLAGLWTLIGIVLFHAAGNTWSDYFDFQRGVDVVDMPGASVLTNGLFTPVEIMRVSLCLTALSLLSSVGLMAYVAWPYLSVEGDWVLTLWRVLWPLLAMGLAGVTCSLLYPALKYRAFGDLVIFIDFALIPTLATSYVITQTWHWSSLSLALPLGLITVAILHANNARDIQTDGQARICTFAMLLGVRMSVWVYRFEVLFPFLWLLCCVCVGVFPLWSLLAFVSLLPVWKNCLLAGELMGDSTSVALDLRTAQLQLAFSLSLSLSFLLGGLLR